MRQQTCNAIGCRALILPREVFCERHLVMLQSDIRKLVEKHYRPGKKPSALFREFLDRARVEILYYQTEGHRVPREADFEW